jgi:hypothetical protein
VPAHRHGDVGESLEIVDLGGHDDVHVLGSSDDSPCAERQAAHQDELDFGLGQSPKDLVKRARGHRA